MHSSIWTKLNTANEHKYLIPTVKYGGGEVMTWAFIILKRAVDKRVPTNLTELKWDKIHPETEKVMK